MQDHQRSSFWYFSILLLAASAFGYYHFVLQAPCRNPIHFKVGTVDSQFGLSQSDFLKDLGIAADMWNVTFQKKLLQYDPQATLAVNLIYDNRQQAAQLRNQIDTSNVTAADKKAELDNLRSQYDSQRVTYENAVTVFNSKVNTFFRAEYDSQRRILENERNTLNALSDQINAAVADYNTLVRNINSKVVVANKSTGEIEEGLYTPAKDTIDIYEYESKVKLIRVLAHEFGHALGLDHNDNPQSIMYKLNQGQNETLSKDDIAALKVVCGIK